MKYIVLLFIAIIIKFNLQAQQKISVSYNNADLFTVLKDIFYKTGLMSLMDAECAQNCHPVTLKARSISIDNLLKKVFHQQPVNYKLVEQGILIIPKNITGKVIDTNDEPISDVLVRGATYTALTNSKGEFILPQASCDESITFSYLGIKQTVNIRGGNSFIIVKMALPLSIQTN